MTRDPYLNARDAAIAEIRREYGTPNSLTETYRYSDGRQPTVIQYTDGSKATYTPVQSYTAAWTAALSWYALLATIIVYLIIAL